jgi:uncharacterized protein (TIGR02996 family)
MNDDATFLPRVIAAPDDDGPRLAYSDWLEERGESDRADLIRVQCELARLPYDNDRVSDLRASEYRLLSRNLASWSAGYRHARFRRGFIERLEDCEPDEFAGPGLFDRHPIVDVEIDSPEHPGWGHLVADCPHLARVETLRLRGGMSHSTDFSDLLTILRSPHLTRLTALDVGGHRYGDESLFRLLGRAGRTLPGFADDGPPLSLGQLRRLSLNEMGLTDRGVRALVESPLAGMLTHLDLSGNGGLSDTGAEITHEGIRSLIDSPLWPRLEELNLGGMYSGDAGALMLLLGALPRSRIRKLGLHGALSPEARQLDLVEALASAASWGSVDSLDLSDSLAPGEGVRILTECPQLAGLRYLNLSGRSLGDEDASRLAACPHLAGLTALLLGNYAITDAGLTALAESPYLGRLVYLDVDHSQVQDAGVAAFARSPNASRLRVWALPGTVGDAGLLAISDSPYLGRLTTLIFGARRNGYDTHPAPTDAGAIALARSPNLPSLAFLARIRGMTDVGLRALLERETLAWPGGWPFIGHDFPDLEQAYRERYGPFECYNVDPREGLHLFPWAEYAFS